MNPTRQDRKHLLPIAVALALLVGGLSWLWLDLPVSTWWSERDRAWTDSVSVFGLRQLGKVWAPVWLLLLWAGATQRTRPVTTALLALLLTLPLVLPLKSVVGRVRPGQYLDLPVVMASDIPERGLSFPSGDSATAFAVTGALVCVLSGRTWGLLLGLCLFTGFLRIVVLAHHLSDVCAGAAIGLLCAYIALRIDHSGFFDSGWLDRRLWIAWAGVLGLPLLWCLEGGLQVLTFGVTVAPFALLAAVWIRWHRA